MTYAVSFSGGKDSTLALDRAVRDGVDVGYLFTFFHHGSRRVRFHGTPIDAVRAQADALGLELVAAPVGMEPDDYERIYDHTLDVLRRRGVSGIVCGNLHLQDVRDWAERHSCEHGLQHVEPLWGTAPPMILRELLARGYSARIVSIDSSRLPAELLGLVIDETIAQQLLDADSVDPAGENGEYHTFVHDGPLFGEPVAHRLGKVVTFGDHMLVDTILVDAGAP